ncbi:MAG: hypothetical protein EBQ89_05520, partial [Alphaproteobacteria bacterium]|nr:hypothetical protein [Alphaproteobacteria bacterium]
MADLDLKDTQRKLAQTQFKSNQTLRFRIYRKLQGMLAMNEPLSRALERLWHNASELGKFPNRPEAMAVREWLARDKLGHTLSDAMAEWIPSAELYMIRAGEESGTIPKSLLSIMVNGERANQMREAVMYAVSYPLFMLGLIGAVMWMFGVNLISNMRKHAPPKVVENMGFIADFSDFVMQWGLPVALMVGTLCIIIAATMPYWRGPQRIKFDSAPPWSWYRIWQGSSFLMGMSALLGAQVPLRRAMEILEEQGNPYIRERIRAARMEILKGRNLGEALRVTEMNFPDPKVAVDLEILSERGDVGAIIEQVTDEWVKEQILNLRAQANLIRNLGLLAVGTIIAVSMLSIL